MQSNNHHDVKGIARAGQKKSKSNKRNRETVDESLDTQSPPFKQLKITPLVDVAGLPLLPAPPVSASWMPQSQASSSSASTVGITEKKKVTTAQEINIRRKLSELIDKEKQSRAFYLKRFEEIIPYKNQLDCDPTKIDQWILACFTSFKNKKKNNLFGSFTTKWLLTRALDQEKWEFIDAFIRYASKKKLFCSENRDMSERKKEWRYNIFYLFLFSKNKLTERQKKSTVLYKKIVDHYELKNVVKTSPICKSISETLKKEIDAQDIYRNEAFEISLFLCENQANWTSELTEIMDVLASEISRNQNKFTQKTREEKYLYLKILNRAQNLNVSLDDRKRLVRIAASHLEIDLFNVAKVDVDLQSLSNLEQFALLSFPFLEEKERAILESSLRKQASPQDSKSTCFVDPLRTEILVGNGVSKMAKEINRCCFGFQDEAVCVQRELEIYNAMLERLTSNLLKKAEVVYKKYFIDNCGVELHHLADDIGLKFAEEWASRLTYFEEPENRGIPFMTPAPIKQLAGIFKSKLEKNKVPKNIIDTLVNELYAVRVSHITEAGFLSKQKEPELGALYAIRYYNFNYVDLESNISFSRLEVCVWNVIHDEKYFAKAIHKKMEEAFFMFYHEKCHALGDFKPASPVEMFSALAGFVERLHSINRSNNGAISTLEQPVAASAGAVVTTIVSPDSTESTQSDVSRFLKADSEVGLGLISVPDTGNDEKRAASPSGGLSRSLFSNSFLAAGPSVMSAGLYSLFRSSTFTESNSSELSPKKNQGGLSLSNDGEF